MDTTEISFPLFGEGFIMNPPSYITVFGLNIYLYGLFIAAGFILAGWYMYDRHKDFRMARDNVLDLILLAVPCGIVGARIYYVLFNFSEYFGSGNWLNIFMLREGGLAVYGGIIGGAIAFLVYSRVKKIPVGKLLDAAGLGLLIGQAIGRWGNFFNREAYGVVTNVPWKMGLGRYYGFIYVHPTFLYESLWNIVGFILLHTLSVKRKVKYHGQLFLCYVMWYGFGRYLIEGIRSDSLYIGGSDIRVSQLLAALSFSAAVVLLLRNRLQGTRNVIEYAGYGDLDSELSDDDEEDDDLDVVENTELNDEED